MAKIEDIIAAEQHRLENVLRAAYEAGKADAKAEMLMVLSGEGPTSSTVGDRGDETSERKRAPKGLPRKFTKRVLFENQIIGGITPQNIVDAAVTEHEKMIAVSTIRSELRKGREDGIYIENDGFWLLSTQEYENMQLDLDLGAEDED